MKTLEVVVGAQFGSEAKGHVVQRLAERAYRDNRRVQVVRVAGPNAGHTGYDSHGQSWALRQVPVAAVVDGPLILGIAAGSEIDLPVLLDEIDRLTDAGLMRDKMLWVHGEATMIYDEHKKAETLDLYSTVSGVPNGNLVQKIGSTGKGIGAARADRIWRTGKRLIDDEKAVDALANRGVPIAHPDHSIAKAMPDSGHLIIEGTQGFGLGLRSGFYPKCTSSDCRAVDFMAMAGVHAWEFNHVDVWAVARMFPIRVAGNSGPLKNETTWEELGLPEERTTVTKKVRRVGMPDWDLVRAAVRMNGGAPTVKVALTMVDQFYPFMRDKKIPLDPMDLTEDQRVQVTAGIVGIERQIGAKIGMVTTGPNTASFI